MNALKSFATLCLLFVFSFSYSQAWKKYPFTPLGSLLSFPKDEGKHAKESIEWWYTVGHLTGNNTGKHYSYMLTYFRYPQSGFDGFRIFNLSHDDNGVFSGETLPVNYTTLAADSLNIVASVFTHGKETWTNKIDAKKHAIPFEYSLSALSSGGSLQLNYMSQKPPLILADSGYFHQGLSSYTYYYSQTGIAVVGQISFDGTSESVAGTAWIDRQYGSFNPLTGEKYEWFNIQLSNGMDLNVFNIFNAANKIPATINYNTLAAYVDTTTQFTTANFTLTRLGYQYTSDSLKCYANKWRLTSSLHTIDLTIEAPHPNYEVKLPFRFYEGTTNITGTVDGKPVTGQGFCELLHAYDKPSVTLTASANVSLPLTWKLNNPDQGRPITYDLAYSTDNQKTFLPIAEALKDTSYYWNSRPANKYWIRLTAYSVDTTLVNSTVVAVSPVVTALEEITGIYSPAVFVYQGILSLELGEKYVGTDVQLTDVQGKSVSLKPLIQGNKALVDVKGLQPGVYIGRLYSDGQTKMFKIAIE